MKDVATREEQQLRAELDRSREQLDGLVRELRELDGELDALAPDRQRHGLVQGACGALEELADLGGEGLFWDASPLALEPDVHLRRVRARIDGFRKSVEEIEARRDGVLEEITREQESCDLLEEDVYDAERQREERKFEWVIERETPLHAGRASVMPWTRGGEDDERFRRSLGSTLLSALLLGVLLPQIDLPIPERWEPVDVPERFARLIREPRPLPPPPPVHEQVRPDEPEPVEPTPVPEESSASKTDPEPSPSPGSKGLLAFREQFSGLAVARTPERLGAEARIQNPGEVQTGRPERSMVATQAAGSSGGINLGSLSRDVGGEGGRIEGVQVARATSSIAGSGGTDRPRSDGPGLARTDEEIQIVFDRHKAALYRLYNRELRSDPTLKGQMVLRIRIEPDGSVSLCALQGSDMNAPRLGAQVVERVRTFDFGAKAGVPTITILYPIDFLPAT